jgi:hypothetical protein
MSGGRYPVLRSFAILYVFAGALAVIGGIIGVIYTLARAPYALGDRVIISLGIIGGTCLFVLTMLAIAEVLKLVIDIEHNTRMAAVGKVSDEMMAAANASATSTGAGERRSNRFESLNEETAEAALLRGH